MTEEQLDHGIRDLAELFGWKRYHTHDSRRSPKGFPDLVLVRAPRVLFIELKKADGVITPEQQDWLRALRSCWPNVETYVWRPIDYTTGTIEVILGRTFVPTRPEPVHA